MTSASKAAAAPEPGRPAGRSSRAGGTAATRSGALLLLALPLAKLLVHLVVGAGYGYHRDELYYLACADHLDWGYVDHPPFSILVLAATRAVLGDSVAAIRLVPAVVGALTVLVVGLMARQLGGGLFAQALAMTAALVAPFYLALQHSFSMNAFDLLLWGVAALIVLRVLRGGSPRLWLLLGVVLGIGLQNKVGVLWLGFGLFVGLLITPQRAVLRSAWPWLAGAIALALFAPHLLWQVRHGWPTLEFIDHATKDKLVPMTASTFLWRQVQGMLVPAAPIWAAGLAFYLLLPAGRGIRALGWAYLAIFALLAVSGTARGAYLAPAYTWLLPAGAVAIEGWMSRFGSAARAGMFGPLVAIGLLACPVVLPVLPAATVARHYAGARRAEERTGMAALPEVLAHMRGWDQIVESVASVYEGLPAHERETAGLLAPNYGVAAAVDLIGRRRGLPAAASGHNSYWMWGPPPNAWDPVIVIGYPEAELRPWFAELTFAGKTQCVYCMPYENDQPIWVARGPKSTPAALWPAVKKYR